MELLYIALCMCALTCLGDSQSTECQVVELASGQDYFLFKSIPEGNVTDSLRGSGKEFVGPLQKYVDIVVSVPDSRYGVKITKLCMFTKGVALVELGVVQEALEIQLRDNRVFSMWGEASNTVGKSFTYNRKWKKSCFGPPAGEVASLNIRFICRNICRVRIQKLFMSACLGDE